MTKQILSSEKLSDLAIKGLQKIKGKDIVRMDMRRVESSVTDFFIIATGTSDRHVLSLAESVMEMMKQEAGEIPLSKEGLQSGEWVLLDFASVVVHIFQESTRRFYRLENLWGDAGYEEIEEPVPASSQVQK